jgi:hypothetical protein
LKGVLFKKIEAWKDLPIEILRGKVRFVPKGKNYGSYIQGSITRLSEKDYRIITQEHDR